MEIHWNQMFWIDCMDAEWGLPALHTKKIDYCFTDPPFNSDISKVNKLSDGGYNINPQSKFYEDKKPEIDYQKWCEKWFFELERVCNVIMIHCGKRNLKMWYKITDPYDILFLAKKNARTGGFASHFNTVYPILVYGKPKVRIMSDLFEYLSTLGVFRKDKHLIHPCPLNTEFWRDLISSFQPKSVIDPFMGSGTTMEVCESVNPKIKWIGYENHIEYQKDFNYRLKKLRGQLLLTKFI